MEVSEQAVGAMQAYLRLKRYILPSGIAREALQAAFPFIAQPSAARKLALEEAAKLLEREADELDGLVDSVSHHLRSKAKTIRSLSSPDHADAGKVEGDGNRETLWKSAARDFGAYLASNGTPYAIDYWNECFGPLFSAPSEGGSNV